MTTIRKFCCNDLLRFSSVNLDHLTITGSMRTYFTWLAQWPDYFIVALAPGNRIKGYILAAVQGGGEGAGLAVKGVQEEGQGWFGHITTVSVHPEYRNQGLGTILMRMFESLVLDKMFLSPGDLSYSMRCYVGVTNKAARIFFGKFGFENHQCFAKLIAEKEDAVDMRKILVEDGDFEDVRLGTRDLMQNIFGNKAMGEGGIEMESSGVAATAVVGEVVEVAEAAAALVAGEEEVEVAEAAPAVVAGEEEVVEVAEAAAALVAGEEEVEVAEAAPAVVAGEEEVVEVEEAATAVVPYDIICEVFSHLPPIQLLRFQFLTKNFSELIFNSTFLLKQASNFHSSALVLKHDVLFCPIFSFNSLIPIFVNLSSKSAPLKGFLDSSLVSFGKEYPNSSILSSCNGLLLSYELDPSEKYRVFNPMLSEHNEIPNLLETLKKTNYSMILSIVFDPSLSPYYKVLAVLQDSTLHAKVLKRELHVYSSQTKVWKFQTYIDPEEIMEKGVMSGGKFYWFRYKDCICYDLISDEISYIPLPEMSKRQSILSILYAGEVGGSVQLLIHHSEALGSRTLDFKIFELHKDTFDWSETGVVNVNNHEDMKSWQGDVRVLHLYEEEGEKVVLLRSSDSARIFPFKTATGKFGRELKLDYLDDLFTLHTVPFTPCLCPLL